MPSGRLGQLLAHEGVWDFSAGVQACALVALALGAFVAVCSVVTERDRLAYRKKAKMKGDKNLR